MAHARSFMLKTDTAYMEVPRCETCQHWVRENDVFGHCRLLAHGNYARELGLSRLAIADDDAHDATLVTQRSFGCVQWEARS